MIDLINWILEEGRDNDDLGVILEQVSERLVASGIPLCRTTLNMPTIDPAAAVLRFQWSREIGVTRSTFAPGRPCPVLSVEATSASMIINCAPVSFLIIPTAAS